MIIYLPHNTEWYLNHPNITLFIYIVNIAHNIG